MGTAIVSARAKREYVAAIYRRYRHAKRPDKQRILDEFCAVTGYHRKAAIRVLTGPAPGAARPARLRPLIYPPPVIEALRDIWVAAGRRGARQGLAQVEADVAAVERALHLLG
jgi:hypothetical protein